MASTDRAIAEMLADDPSQQPGHAHAAERRAYERIAKIGSLEVFPCNGVTIGRAISATLRDISRGGIGINTRQALSLGSGFVLGLRQAQGKVTVMLYTVRRCIPQPPPEGFLIGAELISILRDDEIREDDASALHRVGRALLRGGGARP